MSLTQKIKEFEYRGFMIPAHMHQGVINYVERGYLPGSFLQAVICNDLHKACSTADLTNMTRIPVFVAFLQQHTPSDCWGSYNNMMQWYGRHQHPERPIG